LARRDPRATTFATFIGDITVTIDFAFDNGETRDQKFDALDVAFVSADGDPVDVAVIRIKARDDVAFPPALKVAPGGVEQSRMYVVGHPARLEHVPEPVRAVFGDPDERKRVSFGHVMDGAPAPGDFLHDASTIGGYSGGCVLHVLRHEVRGLHYAGDPTYGNVAISSSSLRSHPAGQWLTEPSA
jgi:hypothetical protein